MKIRPVRAELFHADRQTDGRTGGQTDRRTDGRTDMTKLRVAFRNFAKAPKNCDPFSTIHILVGM
jgi:hypothetical protein